MFWLRWRFSAIGATDAAVPISAESVCQDIGIEVMPTAVRPGDGQTWAGATIAAILEEHGPGV
jgi:hypothetical protein